MSANDSTPESEEPLIDWDKRMKALWADYHRMVDFLDDCLANKTISREVWKEAIHESNKIMTGGGVFSLGLPPEQQPPKPVLYAVTRHMIASDIAVLLKHYPELRPNLTEKFPGYLSRSR